MLGQSSIVKSTLFLISFLIVSIVSSFCDFIFEKVLSKNWPLQHQEYVRPHKRANPAKYLFITFLKNKY
jgi:hypothetical protein